MGKNTGIGCGNKRKGCGKMKKRSFCLMGIGAVAISLTAGILYGNLKNTDNSENVKTEKVKAVTVEEESVLYDGKQIKYYEVKTEGNNIVLSKVFLDETREEEERTEINESVLPKSDVEILKDGIKFANREEALMLIENFIS